MWRRMLPDPFMKHGQEMSVAPVGVMGHQHGCLSRHAGIDGHRTRSGFIKHIDVCAHSARRIRLELDATGVDNGHSIAYAAIAQRVADIADPAVVADLAILDATVLNAAVGHGIKGTDRHITYKMDIINEIEPGVVADFQTVPVRGPASVALQYADFGSGRLAQF